MISFIQQAFTRDFFGLCMFARHALNEEETLPDLKELTVQQ